MSIEILTYGKIENDFERLGVKAENTYKGNNKYKVYSINNDNFYKLCNDISDYPEGVWMNVDNLGLGIYDDLLEVNGEELWAWYTQKSENENFIPKFKNLFDYISKELELSDEWQICQALNDLARLNNLKLSELLNKYQG